ncbi:ethanolamine ammonia-lyase subunit EutC [Clostridium sediminicola]
MIREKELKELVKRVLIEMASEKGETDTNFCNNNCNDSGNNEEPIEDITKVDITKEILVSNVVNKKEYMKMKDCTPARIGIGRCGPRYKTSTLLRFRADHAAAQDAVFRDVSEKFLEELDLFSITTKCKDKDEYLTRPDFGRIIPKEQLDILNKECKKAPKVQIYISDGLSSTAIESNVKDVLPAILQGLEVNRVDIGKPFFLKYGRVPAMDAITETLDAEVTCVLIGERPGLVTAESMSAYITYKGTVGMPEARRTVVSNIHKGGTPPVEAGAHIADIIIQMLKEKASGLDLKL